LVAISLVQRLAQDPVLWQDVCPWPVQSHLLVLVYERVALYTEANHTVIPFT
jgi:hypothetical protein